jgi:hypothetical protein
VVEAVVHLCRNLMVDISEHTENSFDGRVDAGCQAGWRDFSVYVLFKCVSFNTTEGRPIPLHIFPSHQGRIRSGLNSTIPRSFCHRGWIVLDSQQLRFLSSWSIPQLVLVAICMISDLQIV